MGRLFIASYLISKADAILYAGSLVSETAMIWVSDACEIQDSKGMTLEQICDWLINKAKVNMTVLRLQTGDPGLYGALIEMIQPLDKTGIEVTVVPGVTSAMASAAAVETLSLPEVTQTVIFSRVEGRTPMPKGESLEKLAALYVFICLSPYLKNTDGFSRCRLVRKCDDTCGRQSQLAG